MTTAADVRVHDVPLTVATPESVSRYGNVFTDWEREECRLTRWPQPGWRPVADGLGGGVTSGDFVLEWRAGVHTACNSGVADGDYCFAWTSASAACDAAAVATTGFDLFHAATGKNGSNGHSGRAQPDGPPSAFLFTEINYHACGSQLFFTDQAPVIVVLARVPDERAPDDVHPEDFVAFWCPPGVGVNVDAMVWHSPPIATAVGTGDEPGTADQVGQSKLLQTAPVVMKTKQARVHSKVYYDPLAEAAVLLRVPLTL